MKWKLKRERIVLEQADHHTYFVQEALNTRMSQTNSNLAHNKKNKNKNCNLNNYFAFSSFA